MVIQIYKEDWEHEYKIKISDIDSKGLIPLDRKLEQLKFTNEQIDFLDMMFHKLVNRKITIS